jgi:hypothetical protein
LLNAKLTSETFRHKFLQFNKPWLISQLPNILTPRTLRRSRPYLTQQLNKILGSVNPDVSSDDEDEDTKPKFGPVALSNASRKIIRLWLAQARRRRVLREVVQPLINRARKTECSQCLSRKNLQVEMLKPIEVLGDEFEEKFPSDEFDQVAWKNYFTKHAQFTTLCLACVQQHRDQKKALGEAGGAIAGTAAAAKFATIADAVGEEADTRPAFGPVRLSAASRAILLKWLRDAQDRARKRGVVFGIRRAEVSDDESGDDNYDPTGRFGKLRLTAASEAIMRKWLALGRQSMVAKGKTPSALGKPVKKRNKKKKLLQFM